MTAIRVARSEVESRGWWPVVEPLMLAGRDVVVQDPLAASVAEYWDEDPRHGAVQVVRRGGPGWVVSVYELDVTEFPAEVTEDEPAVEDTEENEPDIIVELK